MLNILAVLPALYLMNYVYKHDRVEKEPTGLLIKIFVFGMISTIPTVICSSLLEDVLSVIVRPGSRLSSLRSVPPGLQSSGLPTLWPVPAYLPPGADLRFRQGNDPPGPGEEAAA